ncbi:MAG: helix-hairpin-helix domain-containing protein [Eubacteriales bacterium]|nr:helix-hairpin-helix domain-containing protein [Eubacteriales bacterium]
MHKRIETGRPGRALGLFFIMLAVTAALTGCVRKETLTLEPLETAGSEVSGTAKGQESQVNGSGSPEIRDAQSQNGKIDGTAGADGTGGAAAEEQNNAGRTAGAAGQGAGKTGADAAGQSAGKAGADAAEQNAGAAGQSANAVADSSVIYVYVCGAVTREGVYRLPEGARVFEALEAAGGCTQEAEDSVLNLAAILRDEDQIRVPTAAQWAKENAGAVGVPGEQSGAAGTLQGQAGGISGGAGLQGQTDRASGGSDSQGQTGGYGLLRKDTAQTSQGNGNSAAGEGTGQSGLVNLNTATAQELMSLPGIGESKAEAIIAYRTENGPFSAPEDIMKISGIKEGLFSKIRDRITV